MRRGWFNKFLALLLTLTLAFGHGFMPPAQDCDMSASHSSMTGTMTGTEMAGAGMDHHPCCPMCPKGPIKGDLCAAACAAISQATLPPSPIRVPRPTVRLAYELVHQVDPGRALIPDTPPPKA